MSEQNDCSDNGQATCDKQHSEQNKKPPIDVQKSQKQSSSQNEIEDDRELKSCVKQSKSRPSSQGSTHRNGQNHQLSGDTPDTSSRTLSESRTDHIDNTILQDSKNKQARKSSLDKQSSNGRKTDQVTVDRKGATNYKPENLSDVCTDTNIKLPSQSSIDNKSGKCQQARQSSSDLKDTNNKPTDISHSNKQQSYNRSDRQITADSQSSIDSKSVNVTQASQSNSIKQRSKSQASSDLKGSHSSSPASEASVDRRGHSNTFPTRQSDADRKAPLSRQDSQSNSEKQIYTNRPTSQSSASRQGSNSRSPSQSSSEKQSYSNRPARQCSTHKKGSNSRQGSQSSADKQPCSRQVSHSSVDRKDTDSAPSRQSSLDSQETKIRPDSRSTVERKDLKIKKSLPAGKPEPSKESIVKDKAQSNSCHESITEKFSKNSLASSSEDPKRKCRKPEEQDERIRTPSETDKTSENSKLNLAPGNTTAKGDLSNETEAKSDSFIQSDKQNTKFEKVAASRKTQCKGEQPGISNQSLGQENRTLSTDSDANLSKDTETTSECKSTGKGGIPAVPDRQGNINEGRARQNYNKELVKQVTKKLLADSTTTSSAKTVCVSQSEPSTPASAKSLINRKFRRTSLDKFQTNPQRESEYYTKDSKSLPEGQSSVKSIRKYSASKDSRKTEKMSISKEHPIDETEYHKFEREVSRCSSKSSDYIMDKNETDASPKNMPSRSFDDSYDRNIIPGNSISRTSSRNSNYEAITKENHQKSRNRSLGKASHKGISSSNTESPIQTPKKDKNGRQRSMNSEVDTNSPNRKRLQASQSGRKSTIGHNSMERCSKDEVGKEQSSSIVNQSVNQSDRRIDTDDKHQQMHHSPESHQQKSDSNTESPPNKKERQWSKNTDENMNSPNRKRLASQSSRQSTRNSIQKSMENHKDVQSKDISSGSLKKSITQSDRQNLKESDENINNGTHSPLAEYNKSQRKTSQEAAKSTEYPTTVGLRNDEISVTSPSKQQNQENQHKGERGTTEYTPNTDITKPQHDHHETSKHLKQFIRQDSIRSENLSQRSTPLPYSNDASRVPSPAKEYASDQQIDQVLNENDVTNGPHKDNKETKTINSESSLKRDPKNASMDTKSKLRNFDRELSAKQVSPSRILPVSGQKFMSVQNLSQIDQEDRLLVFPIKPPRRSRSEAMISDLTDTKPLEKPKIPKKPTVNEVKTPKEAVMQRANTEYRVKEEKLENTSSVRRFISETQLNHATPEGIQDSHRPEQPQSEHSELPNVIPKYENMSSKKPILRAKSERYLSSPTKKPNSRSMHDLRRMAMSTTDLTGRSGSMLSGLSDRSETMSELTQLSESFSEQSLLNISSSRATVMRKRPVEDPSERWIKDIIASQGAFHLQGLLTCFYCKNLMEKPQTLTSCLHSFCRACLHQQPSETVEDTRGVLCPKCGTFCSHSRTRDNIFFNELLDIYNLNSDGAHKECRQCPDKLEPSWMCLDCKIDLCEKCHTIHLMIPLLQGHKVIQLSNVDDMVVDRLVFCDLHPDEPIKFNCKECEVVLCIKCKVTEHDTHCIETVDNSLKRLMPLMYNITEKLEERLQNLRDKIKEVDFKIDCTKQMFSKTREDIDSTAEDYIARIRHTQAKLKCDLGEKENSEMTMLHEFMTKLQFKQNQGNNLRDLVTISIMKGRQTSLLAEIQGGIFSNVRDYEIEIQKESSIQTAHPELKPNTKADDIFEEGIIGKTNYHIINVLSSGSMPSYKKFMLVRFEEYFTQPLQKMIEVNLPDQCVSITLVCDQIWAALPYTSCIHVYDRFGELLRQIPVEDRQPRAIHQTNDGDVIMACQYTGLFMMNSRTGEIISKLSDGKFSDICVRDERIFALEYNKKVVIVFRKVGMSTSDCCGVQWLQISSINIALAQQVDSVSTLLVNEEYDDDIYICSYNAHTIFHFNQRGELLGQYGRRGKEVAGELYYPMLCTTDKFGFILLADGENRRLQILDIWGMWREILLEGLRKPYNVTLDSKQSLWITQFNDQYQTWQLIKYSSVY